MPDTVPSPLPCRRPELVSWPSGAGGSYLIRDRQRGESFQLGPEEHFLLARLDGTRGAPELCAAFAERFGEPLTQDELLGFLHLARERGLLQPEGTPAPAPLGANGFSEDLDPPDARLAPAPPNRKGILCRPAARSLGAAVAALKWLAGLLLTASDKLSWVRLRYLEFVPRPDDVFIVTFPRSGTTWMQMILYQLTTDGRMDFPHIAEYCPWFEKSLRPGRGFEARPSPRIFKSHLAYQHIPKGPCKYVYVARDGRDVAVSNYHLHRTYLGYEGTFTQFFQRFLRGKVGYGSWFRHVAGWWAHRHDANVLWLTYEELTRDLEGCLRRIAAFCNLDVPPERFPAIAERCSFACMKRHEMQFDPAVETWWEAGVRLNSFLRAGRVGDGAVYLDGEQQEQFDRAYRRYLAGTGVARDEAAAPGPR